MILWLPSLTACLAACIAQYWVASDPVVHVLFQMPMLALAGALVPVNEKALPRQWVGAVFVLALVTIVIWMLPRSVDAALTNWSGHIAKFVTIPLLIGLPLALTWSQIGPVLHGFVQAQVISMLLLLSFLYTHAPLRICHSYLVDDQYRLGLGFALTAASLAVIWLIPVFVGTHSPTMKGRCYELPTLGR